MAVLARKMLSLVPKEVMTRRRNPPSTQQEGCEDEGLRAVGCGFRYEDATILPKIPGALRSFSHGWLANHVFDQGRGECEKVEPRSIFSRLLQRVQSRTEDLFMGATVPPRDVRALRVVPSFTCKNRIQAPEAAVGMIFTLRRKLKVWGTAPKWLGTGCWEKGGRRAVAGFRWACSISVKDTQFLPWREKEKHPEWLITPYAHTLQEIASLTHNRFTKQQHSVMPRSNTSEYERAMKMAQKDQQSQATAGTSVHGRAAAASAVLREKAQEAKERARKEQMESDARTREQGASMKENLELLKDAGYVPPDQQQVKLLQFCTENMQRVAPKENAFFSHQMASAEAIKAQQLYGNGARIFMHQGGIRVGKVIFEAVNEVANDVYATELQELLETRGYEINVIRQIGRDGMMKPMKLAIPFREVQATIPKQAFEVTFTRLPDQGAELLRSPFFEIVTGETQDTARFIVAYKYDEDVGLRLDLEGSGAHSLKAWTVGMTQLGLSHTELELLMLRQLTENMPTDLAAGIAGVAIQRELARFDGTTVTMPQISLAYLKRPEVLLLIPDATERETIRISARGKLVWGDFHLRVGWQKTTPKPKMGVGIPYAMDKLGEQLEKMTLAPKKGVEEMIQLLEKAREQREGARDMPETDIVLMLKLVFQNIRNLCLPKAQIQLQVLHEDVQRLVTQALQGDPQTKKAKQAWAKAEKRLEAGMQEVQVGEQLVQVTLKRASVDGNIGKMPKPKLLGIEGDVTAGVQQLMKANKIEAVVIQPVFVPSPLPMNKGPWFGEESEIIGFFTPEQFQVLTTRMLKGNLIEIRALPATDREKSFLFEVRKKAEGRAVGVSVEEIKAAKEKIMELLEDLHAIAIPTHKNGVAEAGELVTGTTKMSEISTENVRGVWDIRNDQLLHDISRGAYENLLRIVYDLRAEGAVEFVRASEDATSILVMAKGIAMALDENWDMVDARAVVNGNDNRTLFKDALEVGLAQILQEEAKSGFWMNGGFMETAKVGTSEDDVEGASGEEEVQDAPRFWGKVVRKHPLGAIKDGQHVKYIILAMLNEGVGLTAISKQNLLLVIKSSGFFPAILQASKNEGVVRGQEVDFEKLPDVEEGQEEFEEELQQAIRTQILVWVPRAVVVEGKIIMKMSEQENEDGMGGLTFPNLKKDDLTYQKGNILPQALQRLYKKGMVDVVVYKGSGAMCLATRVRRPNEMQYSVEMEYRMKNLSRKVPFGTTQGPTLMQSNARELFVDNVSDLEDLTDPYLILGARVQEENGVRSMKRQEEMRSLEGAAKAMDVATVLQHPMFLTDEGLQVIAENEELELVNVPGAVLIFSKDKVGGQWGLHQEKVQELVKWEPESGWEGLEEWATNMAVEAEEEADGLGDDMEETPCGTGDGDTAGKKDNGGKKKKKKAAGALAGGITGSAKKKVGPSTGEMLAALQEGSQASAKDGNGAASHTE